MATVSRAPASHEGLTPRRSTRYGGWMGDHTNLWCSLGFAEPSAVYTSATQQARHRTEGWMAEHGFCPPCPADRLPPLPNNTRVGDFRCARRRAAIPAP